MCVYIYIYIYIYIYTFTYIRKIKSTKINVATGEGISRNEIWKSDTEQTMKLE